MRVYRSYIGYPPRLNAEKAIAQATHSRPLILKFCILTKHQIHSAQNELIHH